MPCPACSVTSRAAGAPGEAAVIAAASGWVLRLPVTDPRFFPATAVLGLIWLGGALLAVRVGGQRRDPPAEPEHRQHGDQQRPPRDHREDPGAGVPGVTAHVQAPVARPATA